MSRRHRDAQPDPVIDTVTADAPVMTVTAQPMPAAAPATVDARVATIESTLAALIFSTFAARDSAGKPLVRCRCGLFATRLVSIEHRVAGTRTENLCDGCKPADPLLTKDVPTAERPLLAPADMIHVVKVNRNLEQARVWGAS